MYSLSDFQLSENMSYIQKVGNSRRLKKLDGDTSPIQQQFAPMFSIGLWRLERLQCLLWLLGCIRDPRWFENLGVCVLISRNRRRCLPEGLSRGEADLGGRSGENTHWFYFWRPLCVCCLFFNRDIVDYGNWKQRLLPGREVQGSSNIRMKTLEYLTVITTQTMEKCSVQQTRLQCSPTVVRARCWVGA